jgi:hypothetical protein
MQSLNENAGETISCDVLVAGAGVAGIAAAVAAARGGCRTILIEMGKEIGGTGVRGMLRTICGLYANGNETPTETLNKGLVLEVVSGLMARAPQRTIEKVGKVYVLPCSSRDLQEVLAALLSTEKNLTVLLKTLAVSVSVENGMVTGAAVNHEGTVRNIRARATIDCTGNGDLAAMAGAGFDIALPDEIQMAGYTVRVSGLQGHDEMLALKVPYVLADAVQKAELPRAMRYTMFTGGDGPDEGILKFSVEETVSQDRVKENALRAVRILSERLPSFRHASAVETSGVLEREGRRIRGEYCLTEDNVLQARKFSDGVVKNSWPIELWDRAKGPVYRYVPENDYYEIPFRCLTVKGFHNFFTAGRCISVSHEALGSTRVMGTCIALGDAAGTAAARLVKTGRKDF